MPSKLKKDRKQSKLTKKDSKKKISKSTKKNKKDSMTVKSPTFSKELKELHEIEENLEKELKRELDATRKQFESKLFDLKEKKENLQQAVIKKYKRKAKEGRANFINNLQLTDDKVLRIYPYIIPQPNKGYKTKSTKKRVLSEVSESSDSSSSSLFIDILEGRPIEEGFQFRFFSEAGPMELFNLYLTSKIVRKHLIDKLTNLMKRMFKRLQVLLDNLVLGKIIRNTIQDEYEKESMNVLLLFKSYDEIRISTFKEKIDREPEIERLLSLSHRFFVYYRPYHEIRFLDNDRNYDIERDYTFLYNNHTGILSPLSYFTVFKQTGPRSKYTQIKTKLLDDFREKEGFPLDSYNISNYIDFFKQTDLSEMKLIPFDKVQSYCCSDFNSLLVTTDPIVKIDINSSIYVKGDIKIQKTKLINAKIEKLEENNNSTYRIFRIETYGYGYGVRVDETHDAVIDLYEIRLAVRDKLNLSTPKKQPKEADNDQYLRKEGEHALVIDTIVPLTDTKRKFYRLYQDIYTHISRLN